jgi:hypothetical protein
MKKEETDQEKNEKPTDSTTDDSNLEESTSDVAQLNPKHRTLALSSLAAGYVLAIGFGLLLILGPNQSDKLITQNDAEVVEEDVHLTEAVEGNTDSVISLTGGNSIPWTLGKQWVDPGYTAIVEGEDLTAFVETASFVDVNTPGQYKVIYTIKDSKTGNVLDSVDRFVTVNAGGIIAGANVAYQDRLDGVILNDEKITAVIGDDRDEIVYADMDDRHLRLTGDNRGGAFGGNGGNGRIRAGRDRVVVEDDIDVGLLDRRLATLEDDLVIIDDDQDNLVARLDRKNIGLDRGGNDRVNVGNFVPDGRKGNFKDEELGAVGDFDKNGAGFGKGTMPGVGNGSEVFAYNFPSQGIGAGIGSPAVGAAAGFAGIGAGIGQAVMDGQAVPALGGIGTYSPSAPAQPEGPDSDQDGISDEMEASFRTNPNSSDTDKDGISDADEVKGMSNPRDPRSKPGIPAPGADNDQDGVPASLEALYGLNPSSSDTDGDGFTDGEEISAMTSPTNPASNPGEMGGPAIAVAPGVAGGVAGLVGGAGAGAAAGLVSGRVAHPLGLGVPAPGPGPGYGNGIGDGIGRNRDWNYDHLPKDGNLYIMMHVDGSGSILSTRKALDEMKDTLLKNALLPYYKNDEALYNNRVLVVDGEGERTLKFFADAAKKENVLALVFQDEAQPAYHLPNFNRKPEDHYMDDLKDLKNKLNGYGGLYRGIMFQVDRGKTFAKSFKEFVGNAWRGDGYLSGAGQNLKPYYWQENGDNIRNRNGIVFSDEYHVNSEGDPSYYMNLIMEASRKVGLDLGRYNGAEEDGRYNAKISSSVGGNSTSLNAMCPVKTDRKANPSITAQNSSGQTVAFCCKGCKNKFVSGN